MGNQVTDFIRRRFPVDNNWLDGNCYWMAKILCDRFEFLHIYYLPISGHFIAGDFEDHYYDWCGRVFPREVPYLFEQLREDDPLWYSHIMRNCRD